MRKKKKVVYNFSVVPYLLAQKEEEYSRRANHTISIFLFLFCQVLFYRLCRRGFEIFRLTDHTPEEWCKAFALTVPFSHCCGKGRVENRTPDLAHAHCART